MFRRCSRFPSSRRKAALQFAEDRLQQFILKDRFDQIAPDAGFAASVRILHVAGGAEHHNRRSRQRRSSMDAARQIESVHFRHMGIEQDQLERRPLRFCPLHRGQRRYPAIHHHCPHLPAV